MAEQGENSVAWMEGYAAGLTEEMPRPEHGRNTAEYDDWINGWIAGAAERVNGQTSVPPAP